MDLSRNSLTATRMPWESTTKTSEWLQNQAANGWFVDSFRFKFFCTSVQFHFVRCEPVEATIVYEEVGSVNFDLDYYQSTLPDGFHFVCKDENYAIYTDTTPVLTDDDIK